MICSLFENFFAGDFHSDQNVSGHSMMSAGIEALYAIPAVHAIQKFSPYLGWPKPNWRIGLCAFHFSFERLYVHLDFIGHSHRPVNRTRC